MKIGSGMANKGEYEMDGTSPLDGRRAIPSCRSVGCLAIIGRGSAAPD